MSRRSIRDRLGSRRAPGEHDAGERSWEVVRKAHAELSPARRRHGRRGFAGGLLAGVAAVALVLTPAGAQVRQWVGDAVDPPGVDDAEPSLDRLPGGGRLLVDASTGAWLIDPDGTKRRLGDYEQSAWSPRGLYAAMVSGNSLAAVDVHDEIGEVRWSLTADAPIDDPVWAPSGQRIAYLTRADRIESEIRVVAGDGTDDRQVARRVAPVAPAWRPEREYTGAPGEPYPRHELAYVGRDRRTVHIDEADTGLPLYSGTLEHPVGDLAWAGRHELVVAQPHGVRVISASGGKLREFALRGPGTAAVQEVAPLRDGVILATTYDPTSDRSRLLRFGERGTQTLFFGPGRFSGPLVSPDRAWALIEWPDADQWLFVPLQGDRVRAVSKIASQFSPGNRRQARFPFLAGWCCGT